MKINLSNYKKELSKLKYPIKGIIEIYFKNILIIKLDFDNDSYEMPNKDINQLLFDTFSISAHANILKSGSNKDFEMKFFKYSSIKVLSYNNIIEMCEFIRKVIYDKVDDLRKDAKKIGYTLK